MAFGAHTDFTAVTIIDADTGAYVLTRVDPAEHRCECCTAEAEYMIRSEHDPIGLTDVTQCQWCLIEQSKSSDSPDEFVVNPWPRGDVQTP